jgi:hypothetical protein
MPNDTYSAFSDEQFSALESRFSVVLPDFYRAFCRAYPLRLTTTNQRDESISEREFVANFDRLIELNEGVRDPDLWYFGEHPWPAHFFVIGDDGYGNHFFLDTTGAHKGVLFEDIYSWDIECRAESLEQFVLQIENDIAESNDA